VSELWRRVGSQLPRVERQAAALVRWRGRGDRVKLFKNVDNILAAVLLLISSHFVFSTLFARLVFHARALFGSFHGFVCVPVREESWTRPLLRLPPLPHLLFVNLPITSALRSHKPRLPSPAPTETTTNATSIPPTVTTRTMAQPSSTHERTHRSSSHHHHHRTISSTTLLLALSLILAVLAITLSIPSFNNNQAAGGAANPEPTQGLLGYLTPRRAHGLVARESAVAMREAEVARREAEVLAGSPAGIAASPLTGCAPAQPVAVVTQTVTVELIPTSTVVREVVKEVEAIGGPPPPAWWKDTRIETLHEREQRVSEREKEVAGREETIGKRETDAAKREGWIMEQLM